jgi:2-polyprenyl-3-methyl-5-hydroxy-6-metoxy-1,4-benzoquinol methylase
MLKPSRALMTNFMTNGKDNLVTNRQNCPICQSESHSVLFSARHDSPGFFEFIKFEKFYSKAFYDSYNNGPLNKLLYEIVECNNCHFIYQLEVLNDEGMKLLYNEWLDKELLKIYYSEGSQSTVQEGMLNMIKKHFKKKDKINLMDFGAGYGNFCSLATKLDFNTYAFDLSTDKNDHMNKMGVTIINNLDKYKGYFDFIYVNQVLEHLSDPGRALKNLRECVADKGIIFMAVPDCKNLKKILNKEGLSNNLFQLLSPHQHINAFNNNSLKLLGVKAGLKPLSINDLLCMFCTTFNINQSKFWIKTFIRYSMNQTDLFFSPLIEDDSVANNRVS